MRFGHWFLGLALLGCWAAETPAQTIQVGVGRAATTPPGPIWMSGYGNRNKPSEGVDQPLFTKALTLQQDKEPPLVLITADILGFSRNIAEPIAERIAKEYQVPRANILLVGSHTHTGPFLASGRMSMFDLKGKDAETVATYTQMLQEKVFTAVTEAFKTRSPARLSLGRAKATFAMNRRVFRSGGVNFGVNPDGPADPEVNVLRVETPDGGIRAIVFGYACHCTTLEGNYYRLGGDWAGYAQEYLERAHPGATAFFVTGCGGDANPEP